MIQPGSKNWIEKYFSLIEEGVIDLSLFNRPDNITLEEYLHNIFFDSGIVFGFPSDFLFFKDKTTTDKWTINEKISFLLFECLLTIYISEKEKLNKEDFILNLLEFYHQFENKNSLNILSLVLKESDSIKIENILNSRTHIKSTLKNKLWASYIANSLVYVDVIAFKGFMRNGKQLEECYNDYVLSGLNTIATVAMSNDEIEPGEQLILATFLESTDMNEEDRRSFNERLLQNTITLNDIRIPKESGLLYKLYLLDIAVLTVNSDLVIFREEVEHLHQLCEYLGLPKEKLDHSMVIISRFVVKNNDRIIFLSERSSSEQIYSNFSKRWIKILGRNKDRLAEELKESKELVALVNKSFKEELTDEEKEKVKTQFRDIIKSVPALAIFMLPGGMILLPIILKIVPDLIPSAFKQNEV